MAETDTGADIPAEDSVQEPPAGKRKKSRAGRNLPAAIAVGAAIGFTIIAILIWDRYLWVFLLTAAMPLATHEVVRRLREAGLLDLQDRARLGGLARRAEQELMARLGSPGR